MENHSYSAIFIDYENLYYYLLNLLPSTSDAGDLIEKIIRNLKNEIPERAIAVHAYADFERVGANSQSQLYLLGVESHFVMGTEHKNAADMRLCIDALQVLYTRPEIGTFYVLAGDRDYIPVIQHLKTHAKSVIVVAFAGNISGDLRQVVGDKGFRDAAGFLPEETQKILQAAIEVQKEAMQRELTARARPKTEAKVTEPKVAPKLNFSKPQKLRYDEEEDALRLMLQNFGKHQEVWMSSYLRLLRTEMPALADYQRKELIANLETYGAIVVQKRTGDPHDYSVIIINWDHPDVRELNPG